MESHSRSERDEEVTEEVEKIPAPEHINLIIEFFNLLLEAKQNTDENCARLISLIQTEFIKHLECIQNETINKSQDKLLAKLKQLLNLKIIQNSYFLESIIIDISLENSGLLKRQLHHAETGLTPEDLIQRLKNMQSAASSPGSNLTLISCLLWKVMFLQKQSPAHALEIAEQIGDLLCKDTPEQNSSGLYNKLTEIEVRTLNDCFYRLAQRHIEDFTSGQTSSPQYSLENAAHYLVRCHDLSEEDLETLTNLKEDLAKIYYFQNEIDKWIDEVSEIIETYWTLSERYTDNLENFANEEAVTLTFRLFVERVLRQMLVVLKSYIGDGTKDNVKGIRYCKEALKFFGDLEDIYETEDLTINDEIKIEIQQIKVKLYDQHLDYLLSPEHANSETIDQAKVALVKFIKATEELMSTKKKNGMEIDVSQLEKYKIFAARIESLVLQEAQKNVCKLKFSLGKRSNNHSDDEDEAPERQRQRKM